MTEVADRFDSSFKGLTGGLLAGMNDQDRATYDRLVRGGMSADDAAQRVYADKERRLADRSARRSGET